MSPGREPRTDARKTILFWSALALVISGLFSPWLYTFYRAGDAGMRSEKSAGYHFILTPPAPENVFPAYGIKLDTGRLSVEWVCILAVSGAAWGVARLNRERISPANQVH